MRGSLSYCGTATVSPGRRHVSVPGSLTQYVKREGEGERGKRDYEWLTGGGGAFVSLTHLLRKKRKRSGDVNNNQQPGKS